MNPSGELYRRFLNRPVAALMIFCAVLFLGSVAALRLPVELLPDLAYPRMVIYTAAPGLAADEVERRVVTVQESLLAALPQLRSLEAVADEGYALLSLTFTRLGSAEETMLTIREKLSSFPVSPPVGEPSVLHHDPNVRPVATLVVTADDYSLSSLTRLAEEVFVRRLTQLDGVGSVAVLGGKTAQRTLELDAALLAARGITRGQVEQALAAGISRIGTMREGRNSYSVRLIEGAGRSLAEIPVPGTPYRLSDVGTVTTSFQSNGMVSTGGHQALALLVSKRYGANTVRVVEELNAVVSELRAAAAGAGAASVSISVAFQEATFIRDAMQSVAGALGLGGLLTMLVLVLMLGSLRQAIAVGFSIPFSVAASALLFYVQGVSLNIMSLGGLALGIGMMVDNGIVVSEAAHRQMRLCADRVEAVHRGVAEVAAPITASTLTTVAVFVPIVFLAGPTALLFRDLAIAVGYSLMLSLIVSLTLLPVLLARLGGYGRLGAAVGSVWDALAGRYRPLLRRLNRVAGVVLPAAAVLVGLAVWGALQLPRALLPESGQGRLDLLVTAPPGTGTQSLHGTLQALERALPADLVRTSVCFASLVRDERVGITLPTANEGRIRVLLARDVGVDHAAITIDRALQPVAAAHSVSVSVQPEPNPLEEVLRSGGHGVVVRLRGPAEPEYPAVVRDVRALLESAAGGPPSAIVGVAQRPVYTIAVRPAVLAAERLSAAQVQRAVEDVFAVREVSRTDGGVLVTVTDAREIAGALDAPVTIGGRRYTVANLVDVTAGSAPARLYRVDQRRAVDLVFHSDQADAEALAARLQRAAARISGRLPDGYSVGLAGEHEAVRQSLGSLGWSFLIAAVLVYMIMAAQFESLLLPVLVMLSVPFALTGVVALFLLTGAGLNVMSAIGATVALGIVINDAIILTSAARAGPDDARPAGDHPAVEAAARRMRPIIVTTVTTIAGMLPLAVAGEAAARLRAPLALAVIGGLMGATVLTLVVLPVVLSRVRLGPQRRAGRPGSGPPQYHA